MSVIVATRNRAQHLEATLEALEQLDVRPGLTAEVLVLDNGSTDDTRGVTARASLRHATLRYIHVPEVGKSSALNRGLHEARGEVLAFIDDDVRPSCDWLQRISTPLLDNKCDMVAGKVVLAKHLRRPWMTALHASLLASTETLDERAPETAVGANMAFRKDVLKVVPGFDPELGPGRLGLWEDTLFSMQLRAAGLRLNMAADAVVEHHFEPERLSREAIVRHVRNEARSAAYVAWHWEHRTKASAFMESARFRMLLAAKRWVRRAETNASEGLPPWELNLISGLEFNRHFRVEQRRRRAYERRGLRKLVA